MFAASGWRVLVEGGTLRFAAIPSKRESVFSNASRLMFVALGAVAGLSVAARSRNAAPVEEREGCGFSRATKSRLLATCKSKPNHATFFTISPSGTLKELPPKQ